MKVGEINLEQMLEFQPEQGKVMLGVERMLLFRQQAMGVLRRLMFEQLGTELARSLLSQFGYQCGQGDYEALSRMWQWETDMDALASGPVLHTWEGIVHAEPTHVDYDRERGRFDMAGEWTHSYEAEIHLEHLGRAEAPVCHSLTGYATGWASRFFGEPVICIETACVAKGDAKCRFELREADRWGPEADPWRRALSSTESSMVRTLEDQLRTIREQRRELEELNERQRLAIAELSTPIMEVWDEVLVLPIIGVVDSARSLTIMTRLLSAIAEGQARCVILDVTGVDVVDTQVSSSLVQVVRAAGLLGAHCVVTGINPSVAQSLVAIDAGLEDVVTLRDLKQGLRACLRFLAEESG